MKKIFFAVTIVCMTLFAAPAQLQAGTGDVLIERLALYIPNLLLDALDAFTINLGFGPVAEARLMATRAVDVGAGIGLSAKVFKAHNRQYGWGIEEGWYWSFIFVGEEEYTIRDSSSLVDEYIEMRAGFPSSGNRVYDIYSGARDYWAFGGALGCLLDGELYLHPVEIADFVLGLLLIDIREDNLTFDDFSR